MLQAEINVVKNNASSSLPNGIDLARLGRHDELWVVSQVELLQLGEVNRLGQRHQPVVGQDQLLERATPEQALGHHLQLIVGGGEHLEGAQFAHARRDAVKVELVVIDVKAPQARQLAQGGR